MANTATNVSVGKPKVGGAIYNAPLGTTLPTDATTELTNTYKCLGYVSEDGLTNSNSPSSEQIKAWGGDTVLTTFTDREDTFQFKLLEVLSVDVLKAVYGADKVSGTISTGLTVRANSADIAASVWVFDMVMTGGNLKRIVIPNGKLSELGDIVYRDNEAIGYEMTIQAMPGDSTFDYDTHKEYIGPTGATGATS